MTTMYCDFCGKKIENPEENGDTVQIGTAPEGKLDACDECSRILWSLVRSKSFSANHGTELVGTVSSDSPDSKEKKGGAS